MGLSLMAQMVITSITWAPVEIQPLAVLALVVSAIGTGGAQAEMFFWFQKEVGYLQNHHGGQSGIRPITRQRCGLSEIDVVPSLLFLIKLS